MKESRAEARLIRGVKALGGLCWKFVSPGTAGVPDRIVLLPGGRVALVELKQEKGRLSALQRVRRRELREVGAEVWTLYGPADVDRFLAECGRPAPGQKPPSGARRPAGGIAVPPEASTPWNAITGDLQEEGGR